MTPYYERDGIQIFHGDCRELIPRVSLGAVNVVTDPPYGIGEARKNNASRSVLAQSRDYGVSDWDDAPPDKETLDRIRHISKYQIIFGGNYFELPPSSCWLVWDKQNGENDFADCELAWTNLPKAVRRIVHQWHGMIRKGNEPRCHPTQKPLAVMEWAINQLPPDGRTIVDFYAGSGTTGLAAWNLGREAILCEREQHYCDAAASRLDALISQGRLFKPEPVVETQRSMFGDDSP